MGSALTRGGFLVVEDAAVQEVHAIALPSGVAIRDFQPLAYFDKHMDCIRVQMQDRSVTEHRIDEFYTLCEANHRSDIGPKYVGFVIKGVTKIFHDIGRPLSGVQKLTDILDAVVKHRPGSAMSTTLDLIRNGVNVDRDISIRFDEAA